MPFQESGDQGVEDYAGEDAADEVVGVDINVGRKMWGMM